MPESEQSVILLVNNAGSVSAMTNLNLALITPNPAVHHSPIGEENAEGFHVTNITAASV